MVVQGKGEKGEFFTKLQWKITSFLLLLLGVFLEFFVLFCFVSFVGFIIYFFLIACFEPPCWRGCQDLPPTLGCAGGVLGVSWGCRVLTSLPPLQPGPPAAAASANPDSRGVLLLNWQRVRDVSPG